MTGPFVSRQAGLALWAYTPPNTALFPLLATDYGRDIEALEFSTVAPGGYGDLACIIRASDPRIPRPELAPVSGP